MDVVIKELALHLKPCPFCGREIKNATVDYARYIGPRSMDVCCSCGIEFSVTAHDPYIVDEIPYQIGLNAFDIWNTRATEDELKFYYVASIDEYWIGRRLDNFYYADWHDGLGFVWSKSRYLPWGEHVVDPDTLWKEHTYPSEPQEIPFTEWIIGFVQKLRSKDDERL